MPEAWERVQTFPMVCMTCGKNQFPVHREVRPSYRFIGSFEDQYVDDDGDTIPSTCPECKQKYRDEQLRLAEEIKKVEAARLVERKKLQAQAGKRAAADEKERLAKSLYRRIERLEYEIKLLWENLSPLLPKPAARPYVYHSPKFTTSGGKYYMDGIEVSKAAWERDSHDGN